MPIIIKNGKVYGDRSVTLSQAEYNALSEVEKNNGTTYYIYDVNGVVTANDVALDGGTVETLAGSVATFESSPATATHEVGDYILWNGQLYTVTAAIAVGETLTVGTNITSTNVGSELTALNAGLMHYGEYAVDGRTDGTGNYPLDGLNVNICGWYFMSSAGSYDGFCTPFYSLVLSKYYLHFSAFTGGNAPNNSRVIGTFRYIYTD